MTKRLLTAGATFLISLAVLLFLLSLLGRPGSNVSNPVLAAPSDSRTNNGVSYYLDNFDYLTDSHSYDFNNFIANRGIYCEIGSAGSGAVCNDNNLLSRSFDEVIHFGDSGASLKLDYNVEQANSLASYYESLFNGDTSYDLSSFDEFHFQVKGVGNTISSGTKFLIRFADENWNVEYVEIAGVSGEWVQKVIPIASSSRLDWTQMRELTIIFEYDRVGGSGFNAYPLSGTLYFDNLVFVDTDIDISSDEVFLDLLERRAFQYFWEYADPATGLIRDRATESDLSSIAAVGFGLTAICVAEERGWIPYDEAYTRVLTTLHSFYDDPSDPDDFVVSGSHGLFYHFVNIHDGTRLRSDLDGVSTIDSALLIAGVLYCRQHFSRTEVETLATKLYEAAEWDWFFDSDRGLMHMRWDPNLPPGDEFKCPRPGSPDLVDCYWEGYNEAMILYLLAIGSPTHPIPATSWISWAESYQDNWGAYYGYPVLSWPPLFIHQYSHSWIDFRGKRDDYVNYFRNSWYATLANRAYSKDVWYPDPPFDLWGFTSSDGPNEVICSENTCTCSGWNYRAYGYPPDPGINDGTIAPTAAGGSIVFTPKHSISTLRYMYEHYHQRLWGLYGLKDSSNATCDPVWFDNDYIGIDVGAMLLMIENYRSSLVWNTFMQNQEITDAMAAVGFSPDNTKEPSYVYYREAEGYDLVSGSGIVVEDHPTAWGQKTLQIDSGSEPHPGNLAVYTFTVDYIGGSSMFFEIRYSDDVAGDIIDVYLDDAKKGNFTTDKFGGWDDFGWDSQWFNLGVVTPGVHTITLKVAEENEGKSDLYGVNLDVFRLYTTLDLTKQVSPASIQAGKPLTYTIHLTNTSKVTLTTTITDTLPNHATSNATHIWTPDPIAPDDVWIETFVVTTTKDYSGTLINKVQAAAQEGAYGTATATVCVGCCLYLPIVAKNSP